MKLRYFPCYHDEWLVGQAGLDNAERGLYLTACLLEYSHGGPVPIDELRRNCRDHGNAFNRQLARLLKLGKLTRKGEEITNKRVRNELEKRDKRSEDGAENAAKRWNGNGLAEKVVLPPSNANQNQNQNHKDKPIGLTRARKAEFSQWWALYPHKVGKADAEKKFATARKTASLDQLCEGIKRYIASKPADYQWCNPSVWLNQRRWEDQPAYVNGQSPKAPGHDRVAEFWEGFPDPASVKRSSDWAKRLYDWTQKPSGFWAQQWGPRPIHPDCQAPKHMCDWAVRRARVGVDEGDTA